MKAKTVPPHIEKIYKEEMIRYDQYHESSQEANNIYTYLEWIANLPFDQGSEEVFDIDKAKQVLDKNHYAMDDMKDRILEYIAVGKIAKSFPGKILCLVGPPGVGKTTFAESIAKALGRKFFRVSMGGEHDSAFLKGHRKTYIGSYPGKIIQALKETQTNNCVILIDEIDKIGRERLSGDLQSTLLEILDPVQNNEFTDNYLDFPVDVSKVVFICCANSIEPLSQPLADRMEVITIPSYTNPEKLEIAQNYLLPKLYSSSCIEPSEFFISKELLSFIIESYCRDPGVRSLEKQLQSLFQKGAYEIVTQKKSKNLTKEDIVTYLGPQHHKGIKIQTPFLPVGISTGLAYTGNGGCILYIEVQQLPPKSPLILTGNLGKVMQESIEIASSVCGGGMSLHVNAMAGAVSKEGPSAGVAIAAAIESVKRQREITSGIAMTGELSLRGKVLKIGGILEKVIAAKREGVSEVILPEGNREEFQELKEDVRKGIRVHFVKEFSDAAKILFPEDNSIQK